MKESLITGIVYPVVVLVIGFLAKEIIWNKRRNIIKWCVTKCKNIATTYKNIKAKIVDNLCNVWEIAIGREKLKKRYELKITEMNIAHQIRINELEVAHQSEIRELKEVHRNEIQNIKGNTGTNYLPLLMSATAYDGMRKQIMPGIQAIDRMLPEIDRMRKQIMPLIQAIECARTTNTFFK